MKKLYVLLIFFVVLLIGLEPMVFNGFDKEYFSGLSTNFLTEIAGIIVTLLIVERMIGAHKHRQELETIKDVLGNQYEQFVYRMAATYIHFVTKKPFSFTSGSAQIDQLKHNLYTVVANINTHVQADFIRPVSVTTVDPNNLFSPNVKVVSYQEFCELYFKQRINQDVTEFLSRYVSILPIDVRNSIFKISDILKSNILYTPLQDGLRFDISRAKINVDDFRKDLRELGEEIEKLLKHC